MSNLISIGLFVLVFCIVYSRSISKEALNLLTDEEKTTLAEKFAGFSKFSQVPIIGVFASYIAIKYLHPSFSTTAFILLIVCLITSLLITSALILKKMKTSTLPKAYIQKYTQSRILYNLGFIVCGALLLYELLK